MPVPITDPRNLSVQVKKRYPPWSVGQRTCWCIPPVMLLLLTVVLVVWISNSHMERYWAIQRSGFFYLNDALSGLPALAWSNLTRLGDGGVLLIALAPLLIWRPRAWFALVASVPAASLLSTIPKHLFSIPRPAAVVNADQLTVIGHTLTAHNSLPSGHALTVFTAVVAVLASVIPRPRGVRQWSLLVAGLLAASVVSLSRIAVGAHWPLDLVVGAALGWIAGLTGATLALRYQSWWRFWQDTKYRYLLGCILLVSSIWLAQSTAADLSEAPMVWLSALGGLIASGWLLRPEWSINTRTFNRTPNR